MSDIESQTQDPAVTAGDNAASVAQSVEETQSNDAGQRTPIEIAKPEKEPSFHDKMKSHAEQNVGQKGKEQQGASANGQEKPDHGETKTIQDQDKPPSYQANLKYKAFGKEKELDPFFASLVKDPESEKRVKEVFTRADAFDDMKQRYEGASQEFQKISKQHQDLDKDVKRVMHFRNSGDLDNFFASVQLGKDDIFRWAQRQLDLEKLSPEQQQAYQQGIHARAENVYNQQNYASMQQQMADQRAQMMQIQLDHTLTRPEITSAASSWDQKMGDGAFRALVIDEAAKNTYATGQVWTPEEAVKNVINKFGKLLENPLPQANGSSQTQAPLQQMSAPQVQTPVVVQGKPVIPNIQGKGTSPIKQAPKSLAELRAMGRAAQMAESQVYEG